jgi:hypothetical protein
MPSDSVRDRLARASASRSAENPHTPQVPLHLRSQMGPQHCAQSSSL